MRSCKGLTLIEVLASTALLAMLLAATAVAYSEHAQQIRQAHRRLEAIEQADILLASWYADPQGIPANDRGELDKELIWQTTPLQDNGAESLACEIIRLQLFGTRTTDSEDALARVDVLVAADDREGDGTEASGADGRNDR